MATLTDLNGKANSSHTHSTSDITSGTLPLARGGTGVTSISALKSALGISSSGSELKMGLYTDYPNDITYDFKPMVVIAVCHISYASETPMLLVAIREKENAQPAHCVIVDSRSSVMDYSQVTFGPQKVYLPTSYSNRYLSYIVHVVFGK